jgi:hypothetical protein
MEPQAAILLGRPQGISYQEVDAEVMFHRKSLRYTHLQVETVCRHTLSTPAERLNFSIRWTLMMHVLQRLESRARFEPLSVIHRQACPRQFTRSGADDY